MKKLALALAVVVGLMGGVTQAAPSEEATPVLNPIKRGIETWTAESPMNNIEVFHFVQIRGQ